MPHDVEKHSHSLLPSDPELKVKALETALVKRGLIDPAALDEIIDTYQNKIGPKKGAIIIAKAVSDKNFKSILEKHKTKKEYYLKRKIKDDLVKKISDLNLPHVYFIDEYQKQYPHFSHEEARRYSLTEWFKSDRE